MVGERAQRDAGGGGEAAVTDGADPLAADQLEGSAQDALSGAGRLAAALLDGRLYGRGGRHRCGASLLVRSNDLAMLEG